MTHLKTLIQKNGRCLMNPSVSISFILIMFRQVRNYPKVLKGCIQQCMWSLKISWPWALSQYLQR